MLQAYNKQYGFKGVALMPCNLYGPKDNYHSDNSHVIPALIKKFHASKTGPVICWGDGSPSREFMYVDDLANACLFAIENYENGEVINVGSGEDVSIKTLAETISNITCYSGEILWDTSKPNGTPKRPLDCSKILSLGWQPEYSLKEGLKKSYQWYLENII